MSLVDWPLTLPDVEFQENEVTGALDRPTGTECVEAQVVGRPVSLLSAKVG
jgi:hypothetical protein